MDPELFTYMTRVHYHDPGDGVWGEHEIDHVLFFQSDVKVKPNSNEISEYCFVPKAEFNSWVQYHTLIKRLFTGSDLVQKSRPFWTMWTSGSELFGFVILIILWAKLFWQCEWYNSYEDIYTRRQSSFIFMKTVFLQIPSHSGRTPHAMVQHDPPPPIEALVGQPASPQGPHRAG